MIRITSNSSRAPIFPLPQEPDNLEDLDRVRREKERARSAARRAAAKAAKGADAVSAEAPSAEASAAMEPEPVPVKIIPPTGFLAPEQERRERIEAMAAARVAGSAIDEAPKAAKRCGLAESRADAIAFARQVYGTDAVVGEQIEVKKTARGEWYWGPIDQAAKAAEQEAAAKATEKRQAKAERKASAKAERKAALGETRPDGLKPGTAAAKMVDAVLKPEGATYQELLDVTGWAHCRPALVSACERAGVTLRLDREQKPSRYYGARLPASHGGARSAFAKRD